MFGSKVNTLQNLFLLGLGFCVSTPLHPSTMTGEAKNLRDGSAQGFRRSPQEMLCLLTRSSPPGAASLIVSRLGS
jgi:hypothetical protein